MPSIRRILVALDLAPHGRALTPGSRLALDQALAIAPVLDASLLLFHGTAPDEIWDPEAQKYVLRSAADAESLPALAQALQQSRNLGLVAELSLSSEATALAIVERVLRDGVDLVLAGKRNHGAGGAWPGSVSAKLLRKCPCPVWVVKPGSALRPARILAASDLSPVGERVLALAAFVAEHCSAALHLLHAFQRPLAAQLEGDTARFVERERERCTRALEEQLARVAPGRAAEFHVGVTSPTEAILACDARVAPDLVVMGSVSRGGIAGWLLGNTAQRLVERLDRSLLTVKPDDFVCPVRVEAD
jgi:universal stress protein E